MKPKDININIRINNNDFNCTPGTKGVSLIQHFGTEPGLIAAMKANNEILSLDERLEVSAVLEPVLLDSSEGKAIYRRTLAFLLSVAARKLFPDKRLYIGHSMGNGYYYTFTKGKKLKKDQIEKLSSEMHSLVKKDLPIHCRYIAYNEALELFTKNQQTDTALLLSERNQSKILINECENFIDLYIAPLLHCTGLLKAFELMAYQDGFLLRFPPSGQKPEEHKIAPFNDIPKLFTVYNEYKKWGRIIGVHAVGHLNRKISEGSIRDYIHIAEAFQEKKLVEIAEQIYKRKDSLKTILIAGPSSSGKTTTAKRLSFALKVMGIEPIAIGLDDYYVGTENTPLDENGKPDFECLKALDIEFLNKQLLALHAGKEVTLPVFDFKSGNRRESGGRTIKLDRRTMLIIEGIHGLNDELTPSIERDSKFKLYVSALTQLNLDDHNRIPTRDNRLLRRMVRDSQFRGAGAIRTFQMWPSVLRGENKHIFPFQNEADAAFNSALDYELAVLKFYAEPLLHSIKPGMHEYAEAVRLLSFLENFTPIPPQYVPGKSILREFIGDSEFKY